MSLAVYADFEFRKVSEPVLDLVSCSLRIREDDREIRERYWLFKDPLEWERLKERLLEFPVGTEFVAYAAEAEARCLLDLGVDPLRFSWIDLYLEYKMFSNHNWEIEYGKHLVDGEVRTLKPFQTESGSLGLGAAVFKFCNKIIDTERKDRIRDILINGTDEEVEAHKDEILEYGDSDTEYLPLLRQAIGKYALKKVPKEHLKTYKSEAYKRGEYACRSARMLKDGYPINLDWARNLSNAVMPLFDETIRDINAQFPGNPPFYFNKKTGRWSQNQKAMKQWIKDQGLAEEWEKTDTKDISLSLDAWTKFYDYRHEFPRGNFGAQIVRFLKLKQSLNGLINKAGKDEKSFWDYVGSDRRVRPYFNIYGAQSSRTQPSSTSFIFLKPAWQRSIVQPPEGHVIIGLDYSSQEFLLSALRYCDDKMVQAYASGDVYLYFAKDVKMVPKEATKDSHSYERDLCKGTVLGISYLMSKIGLSRKLTNDTGKPVTEDEAQYLINSFEDSFQDFANGRREAIDEYASGVSSYVRLPCGWYMWGDNPNPRSVGNVPIQGSGASILREAVARAQRRGCRVIFTLHDAIYIEAPFEVYEEAMDDLAASMKEAFCFYFEGKQRKQAELIRLEGKVWGPDFQEETLAYTSPSGIPYTTSKIHIDKRAKKEFDTYKDYMTNPTPLELL